MSESPALNALRAAGYCPEHIGTAQGEDCPECEIKGLRLLLNEYRERITKLREGILAAKHEGCACDFHLYGMDADLDSDEAMDRFDSLVIERNRMAQDRDRYRSALDSLLDHARDVRGYADGWEWKYGQAWDEEENAAENLLYGCQAG